MNSDDCYLNYKVLSEISKVLKRNREIDILSCSVWVVDEKEGMQLLYDNILSEKEIYQGKTLPHPGMIVKSKIMKENHFDEKYKIVSDYDFFLKSFFVKKYKFEFSYAPIVFFGNGGISSHRIRYQEHALIMEKYKLSSKMIKKMQRKAKNSLFYRIKRRIEMKYLKSIEEKVKCLLVRINIKKSKNMKWVKHKCNLKICRWCRIEK